MRKPNAAFSGQSALDVMMRGEMTDLIDLRSYLEAERGA
ncbi:antitoxin Xre/MbcA/ParS toxin-binding domain-containing protein [Thalassobacter stenotrophicus]|nr:antitoxin Xre/MbcA/ParS toxin-binding domain-containing protein [Thalassobacter stenotrophicus]